MTSVWLSLLWASLGAAHSAQLTYQPAEGCPPEATLRAAVARRLQYDPFHEFSSLRISIIVAPERDGYEARVNVRRPDTPPADRALTAKTCDALVEALGLALAVVIDPERLSASPRVEPNRTPLAARAQSEGEPVLAPQPSWNVSVRLLGGVELGLQPSGWSSGSLGVTLQRSLLKLGFDAFLAPESHSHLAVGGSVDTLTTGASVSACASPSWFSVCLVGRAGAMRYHAQDLEFARSGWTPVVAAGARAELEWPRENVLAGVLMGEALVPVVRTRLLLGDREVWSPPVVQGRVALGLRLRVW